MTTYPDNYPMGSTIGLGATWTGGTFSVSMTPNYGDGMTNYNLPIEMLQAILNAVIAAVESSAAVNGAAVTWASPVQYGYTATGDIPLS